MPDNLPDIPALTQAIRTFLEKDIVPQVNARSAYLLKVVANLLDIIARESNQGRQLDAQETASLAHLLGVDHPADASELNVLLCKQIMQGDIALDSPSLWQHLCATTEARLAIDNPRYRYSAEE